MASLRTNAAGFAGGSFAVDPATGEVLVMASNPTYDPNDFTDSLNGIPASLHPQLNCAIQCADPTGSIFKIVTLAAGLENGINTAYTCNGTFQVPGEDHLRYDDKTSGHGTLTPRPALGESCDDYFWNMSVELNVKDPTLLPQMGKAFGYGAPTGIVGVPGGRRERGTGPRSGVAAIGQERRLVAHRRGEPGHRARLLHRDPRTGGDGQRRAGR